MDLLSSYEFHWQGALVELSVYVAFALALRDAIRQGRNWASTLISGALAGYLMEVLIVKRHGDCVASHLAAGQTAAEAINQCGYFYTYGEKLFLLNHWDVPIWLGPGWGVILYIASWTAHRLRLHLVPGSFVAGIMAMSIDFSLDPIAHLHGFWVWNLGGTNTIALRSIPFDNFIAWAGIVAMINFSVRGGFNFIESRFGSRARQSVWCDLLLPPAALLLTGAFFFYIVGPGINALYEKAGNGTTDAQPAIFFVIALVGSGLTWRATFASSRIEPINRTVLCTAIAFHLVCLVIFVFGGKVQGAPELLIMIPMSLAVSFFAFGWPSLDLILGLKRARHDLTFDAVRTRGKADVPLGTSKSLESYGGARVTTTEYAPATLAELEAVFRYAHEQGRRVTFRGGGSAFDTQSLNTSAVVSLQKFDGINVDAHNQTVTVGCGARWRDILAATRDLGLVPYVMVTTGAATAGGTLSADCLSRFSPTCGKEGQHVVRFLLLTPQGQLLECSRNENERYFRAAIGGLGYIGAIVEITYELMALNMTPRKIALETLYTRVTGYGRIAEGLLKGVIEDCRCSHALASQAAHATRIDPTRARALSVAVNLRGGAPLGLLGVSRYIEAESWQFNPSVFHSPNTLGHMLLQVAALFPRLRSLGYFLVYKLGFKEGKTKSYVDDLFGFTFFQDGNRRLRRVLRWLKLPAGIRQQTFVIPCDPSNPAKAAAALEAFMTEADGIVRKAGLDNALIDILYIPDETDEGFALSSSIDLRGFAITYTFEKTYSNDFGPEESALQAIADLAQRVAGRVHLVKNVHATRTVIEAMYQNGLREIAEVRRVLQAEPVFFNEFAERVLFGATPPEIAAPGATPPGATP